MSKSLEIKSNLVLSNSAGVSVGDERFRLLEIIDRVGSISAAAKEMGLSYKGAWDAANALNNLFPKPLIESRHGGKHGGGAVITEEGRKALLMHRQLTDGIGKILASLQESDGDAVEGNTPLWSLLFKTSVRNTFHGVISSIRLGAVNAEVQLKISNTATLTTIVTNHSVRSMPLKVGQSALAMINANAPILMREDEAGRSSARNQIPGVVASVEEGAVNSEVELDIGDGKTLVAIVTDDSVRDLRLKPGVRCFALVKAPQVILGVG